MPCKFLALSFFLQSMDGLAEMGIQSVNIHVCNGRVSEFGKAKTMRDIISRLIICWSMKMRLSFVDTCIWSANTTTV